MRSQEYTTSSLPPLDTVQELCWLNPEILLAAGWDGSLTIFKLFHDQYKFQRVKELKFGTSLTCLTKIGQTALIGTAEGQIFAFDPISEKTHKFYGHQAAITALDYDPGSKALLSSALDKKVVLFRQDLRPAVTFPVQSPAVRAAFELHSVAGIFENNKILLWDIRKSLGAQQCQPNPLNDRQLNSIAIKGSKILLGTLDGSVVLNEVKSNKCNKLLIFNTHLDGTLKSRAGECFVNSVNFIDQNFAFYGNSRGSFCMFKLADRTVVCKKQFEQPLVAVEMLNQQQLIGVSVGNDWSGQQAKKAVNRVRILRVSN